MESLQQCWWSTFPCNSGKVLVIAPVRVTSAHEKCLVYLHFLANSRKFLQCCLAKQRVTVPSWMQTTSQSCMHSINILHKPKQSLSVTEISAGFWDCWATCTVPPPKARLQFPQQWLYVCIVIGHCILCCSQEHFRGCINVETLLLLSSSNCNVTNAL